MITKYDDVTFSIPQPHPIDRIIISIPIMKDSMSATTPTSVGVILVKDIYGDPR